jgi:hypothetical protein
MLPTDRLVQQIALVGRGVRVEAEVKVAKHRPKSELTYISVLCGALLAPAKVRFDLAFTKNMNPQKSYAIKNKIIYKKL